MAIKSVKSPKVIKPVEAVGGPVLRAKMAVIDISGHQFLVGEGQALVLDQQGREPGEKIEVDKVLLFVESQTVKVGTPYVAGAKVILEVLENKKGKKLEIYKFKAKSRYRKHIGFRAKQTVVKVLSISD